MSKINLHNYEAFLIDHLDGNLNESVLAELKAFLLSNPQLDIDLDDLDLPSFSKETIKVDFKNDLKKQETFVEDEEIISFLENKLTKAEVNLFESKLLNDKVLRFKLEKYKNTILSHDPLLIYPAKAGSIKTENDLILNNDALAYTEGQLSSSDKLKFETELKTNSSLQKEVSLFNATKLSADASILFPYKEDLKKETKVIALFSFRTVVSVAAAILLLIGFAFVFNYYNSKPVITNELAKNSFNKTLKSAENQLIKESNFNDTLIAITPQKSNLIAKKASNSNNNGHSVIELNEAKTSSVASNQLVNNDVINETKTIAANLVSKIDTNNSNLASHNLPDSHYSKQNYIITEELDLDEPVASVPAKKGFWQRAVNFAKQANKLGIKSVDGEETSNKNYSLSFNSFSVEKR